MRNPNGYGSVVKLSGNRRRPYAVRKTIGFNEKGHPIYKAIGYTCTREEGMIILAEYNQCPYDIDMRKITVKELYSRWAERDFSKMSKSSSSAFKAAWKHCEPVYNMRYHDLKAYQMQGCIDQCKRGYSTKGAIKNLFGHLDKFALELDIIDKKYSELISAPPIPDTKKLPFTEDEIQLVWNICDRDWVDSVLCFLYMGWRISELLDIRADDVDLNNNTIIGGTKTRSGKNRIVPIHPKILPLVEKRYKLGDEYLFSYNNKKCSLGRYYSIWYEIMDELDIKHTPHECRHTFRSRLDSGGGNKVCIDMLMGHKSNNVGERVYTHKTIEELKNTINILQ